MSLFNLAAAAAISAAQRATNVTVELRRGELSTSDVPVAIGSSKVEIQTAESFVVEEESRDYLIKRADYRFDDEAVEPLDGDQIVETNGDTVAIYELLPLGQDPSKRFWDRGRTVWRCHTKLVSETVA
ncbi:MAG: hypothetical protein K8U03_09250 [Planctomycetia bacterium]|nr:hypothetical protein [Planctomycetia bacterium]